MKEEDDYSNYREYINEPVFLTYDQLYTLYKDFLTAKESKILYKKLNLNHKRTKRQYNERRNKRTKS